MRDVWTKVVDKVKTHILCSITFSKIVPYEILWKNTVQQNRPQMTIWPCALHAGYLRLQIHAQNM